MYSMSAGELGVMVHGVENDLERIFELSTRWGAVVLVNEYGVFLERHSLSDVDRNIPGSIFPWLLEYYQEMLLSANRLSAFYPPSSHESNSPYTIPPWNIRAVSIWKIFAGILSEFELAQLAHDKFNGRHIKNIIKTATAIKHVNPILRMKRGVTEGACYGSFGLVDGD